jgi:hypothetical protein
LFRGRLRCGFSGVAGPIDFPLATVQPGMDPIHARFIPASTRNTAAPGVAGGFSAQQGWQALRRLMAWRPVVAVETLILLAALAFTAFYNHAFWLLLFR